MRPSQDISLDDPHLDSYLNTDVTSDDPQADVAAQGMKRIGERVGSAIESGPSTTKAPMEGVDAEGDPVTSYVGGNLQKAASKIIKSGGDMVRKHFSDGGDISLDDPHLDQYLTPSSDTATSPASNTSTSPANDISLDDPNLDSYLSPDQPSKYSSGVEQFKAGLEGAAEGVAGPLATSAELALGVKPEDIRGRAEENPWTHGIAKGATFLGSALLGTGEAALVGKAGEAAAGALGLGAKALDAASLSQKIGASAIKGATEMGLLQSGDELTNKLIQDPNTSTQTAIPAIGLAALMGGAGGAAFGAISPLWKGAFGSKAAQFIEDFKGGVHNEINNPNPTQTVLDEVSAHYNNIKDIADDVYGPKGIKAQDIAKVMPAMSESINKQATDIGTKLQETVSKLAKDPHVGMLQDAVTDYTNKLGTQDPAQIFEATQTLKQQLQEWGEYNKKFAPLAERPFRNAAQNLAYTLRNSLEDSSVWGKAAERQKAINSAFSEYLPSLKDFEKKFTTQVEGVNQIDPGKVNTYMNQLGKPSAEIKQQMLGDFLKASDKYAQAINDSHVNLGIDSPYIPSPLNATRATLNEITPGAKLAKTFVGKGLAEIASKLGSAGIGGSIGGAMGHPGLGILIGEHTIAPFLKTMLPAIAKPLFEMSGNGAGLKSAADMGAAIVKGDSMLTQGAKNVFKAGAQVIPLSAIPKPQHLERLNKQIVAAQNNPDDFVKQQQASNLGHYMPAHAEAIGKTTAGAVQYLNSMRPDTQKSLPLDATRSPSSVENAHYQNALMIAQQPMTVLNKVKEGTITPDDIQHLTAMFPAFYNESKLKLSNAMTDHLSKGESIPYATRIGMSMYLQQPLDSTMTPQSITAAQPQAGAPQQQSQGGGVKHSAKSLEKMSSQYLTPGQARQKSHGKVD